jgi:hypothetical protein
MEKFEIQPSAPEIPTSREGLVIKKLKQYLADDGRDINFISKEDVFDLISRKIKVPGTTPDGVIVEMKK